MAYTQQSAAASESTGFGAAFGNVMTSVLGAGSNIAIDLLKAKGEKEMAKIAPQKAESTQQFYTQLAAQSPNLGPNDPGAARVEAVQQTGLMTGLWPKGMASFGVGWVIVVIAVAAFVFVVRKSGR